MRRQDVEKWVAGQVSVSGAHRSRNLSHLTGAVVTGAKLGTTSLGLGLSATTSLKHRIKRVDRFLGNERIDMELMFALLSGYWTGSRSRVLLALDWTEVPGGFPTLVLSVVLRGRSVPIAWGVFRSWRFPRSRNALEEGLLTLVESYWPAKVQRVLIADRGFGRTELARYLQDHGWGYILRVDPNVWVRDRRGQAGLYRAYPVDGHVRQRRGVQYRAKHEAAEVDLVWTHQRQQHEPWHLITNLVADVGAGQVVRWYGRRMQIEEMFRDGKNERWGFGLKETRLRQPQRWEHLLLILAWAMLILMLVGAEARRRQLDRGLCSSSRRRLRRHRLLSDITVGLRALPLLNSSMFKIIKGLATNQNWG